MIDYVFLQYSGRPDSTKYVQHFAYGVFFCVCAYFTVSEMHLNEERAVSSTRSWYANVPGSIPGITRLKKVLRWNMM